MPPRSSSPRDENSRTVFYERLVAHPEEELRRLCAFLGEEFEPGMLDTRVPSGACRCRGNGGRTRRERLSIPRRAFAWKRGFPREDLAALEVICQEGLDRYGYKRTAEATTTHDVYTLDARTVEACEGRLRRAAAAGIRFLPLRYESVSRGRPAGCLAGAAGVPWRLNPGAGAGDSAAATCAASPAPCSSAASGPRGVSGS